MTSPRARRGIIGTLLCLTVTGAMSLLLANPASAATFKVTQTWNRTTVPEGTPATVTYSWPGGGGRVTTSWGDGTSEVHDVPVNSRTLSHTWDVPCNVASKNFNVFTTVTKGNGDAGSAAIAITVTRVGPACA